MFNSLQRRARMVATTGVVAALAVAGVAVAQNNGDGGSGESGKQHSGKRMMPPPPGGPLGKAGKNLTYGELHVQRNGEDETIRLDAGKVVSVSDSSITVEENDGNEVTREIDGDTKLLAGPRSRGRSVSSLKQGQNVIVAGPKGEAAKTVAVPPKHGKMPPPGGPQGGPPQLQG